MKTKMVIKALMTAALAGSLFSCSKGSNSGSGAAASSSSNAIIPPATTVDNYGTGAGSGFNSANWPDNGTTAVFTPVSIPEMNSWVGIHPLNAPKNFRIKVNLTANYTYNSAGVKTGGPYYSGSVSIGYTDTGVWYESYMTAGSGTNVSCSNCNDNGALEAKYNYFYNSSKGVVFSGFFQDQWGGVVITLEPGAVVGADAEGGKTWNGRVFYRNFAQSVNPQSPYRKCWFITAGPYACDSATVYNKTSTDSIANYKFLGSFTGLKNKEILK